MKILDQNMEFCNNSKMDTKLLRFRPESPRVEAD